MIRMNPYYEDLQSSYLFTTIARKVQQFQQDNSDIALIKAGIGDVTEPLSPAIIEALHQGVEDMAKMQSFKGYGPEQGYDFLRELIAKNDYQNNGVDIKPDNIFISDGSKCDTANFQELFAHDITVAIPDPVYPVYLDTNVMGGRAGKFAHGRYDKIVYLPSTIENDFIPSPKELQGKSVDLIYLCFPNNPTGAVATKAQLKEWVDYAKANNALILFDAAYESYIRQDDLPRSIFEIEGAKEVAVEFRSFSKKAGFTGLRCGFVVICDECQITNQDGKEYSLASLWNRRHTTKFNGASYLSQCGAAAVYTPQGKQELNAIIQGYQRNADLISSVLEEASIPYCGGINAPYLWLKVRNTSWDAFDLLLNKTGVVTTPGSGFGTCGENYIRISAFNSYDNMKEAMQRIKPHLETL